MRNGWVFRNETKDRPEPWGAEAGRNQQQTCLIEQGMDHFEQIHMVRHVWYDSLVCQF